MWPSLHAALGAAAALALAGCNDLDVCGATEEALLAPDGGVYRCAVSEDCPAGARVFVCTSSASPEQECVACVETRCQRTLPVRCQ